MSFWLPFLGMHLFVLVSLLLLWAYWKSIIRRRKHADENEEKYNWMDHVQSFLFVSVSLIFSFVCLFVLLPSYYKDLANAWNKKPSTYEGLCRFEPDYDSRSGELNVILVEDQYQSISFGLSESLKYPFDDVVEMDCFVTYYKHSEQGVDLKYDK